MIYARFYIPVAKVHRGSFEKNEIDCTLYCGDDKYGIPEYKEAKDWLHFYKADNGAVEIEKVFKDPSSYKPDIEDLRKAYYSNPNSVKQQKK